jgi:hypothetical protein
MKTSNVKVRLKDIRQGVTIYVSHPVYGINKYFVTSRPYKTKHGSLMFNTKQDYSWGLSEGYTSTMDCGICCENTYNGRRTFFKLKHAEEWQRKSLKDPKFLAIHKRHEAMCRDLDDREPYDPWEDEDHHDWDD